MEKASCDKTGWFITISMCQTFKSIYLKTQNEFYHMKKNEKSFILAGIIVVPHMLSAASLKLVSIVTALHLSLYYDVNPPPLWNDVAEAIEVITQNTYTQ